MPLLFLENYCVMMGFIYKGRLGPWRRDSGSPKCFWLSHGYELICPEKFLIVNGAGQALTQAVFCGGISFLFLYRLPDVEMVVSLKLEDLECRSLMSRRLLFYTPSATVVRLLTTNFLIAYITSWVLYLSGASEDPRMLLPAWVSIATVCFEPSGQVVISATDHVIDTHHALSSYTPQYQYQKGNLGVDWSILCC